MSNVSNWRPVLSAIGRSRPGIEGIETLGHVESGHFPTHHAQICNAGYGWRVPYRISRGVGGYHLQPDCFFALIASIGPNLAVNTCLVNSQ
jgi:hypothetical protein